MTNILYGPAIFLAKLSVLLLYLELFVVNTQARIMIAIGLTIITAQCLAQIIGSAVFCVPKPGVSWLVDDYTYKCRVTFDLFAVIMGAIAVFSDLFVIYIPLPVVWQLRMSARKKIGVSVIFLTGLLSASLFLSKYIQSTQHDQQCLSGQRPKSSLPHQAVQTPGRHLEWFLHLHARVSYDFLSTSITAQ